MKDGFDNEYGSVVARKEIRLYTQAQTPKLRVTLTYGAKNRRPHVVNE
ncbi:MAG: hypothetical protein U5K77_03845 [Candidatus Saccharibacteria bacterium]|nr:hypothetical protein [Candidatus Saccharibacteria bacterium]